MKKAQRNDKALVVDIFTKSFDTNLSVNYIIKQDANREKRIRALMDYSFEMCMAFGDVFLSDEIRRVPLLSILIKRNLP